MTHPKGWISRQVARAEEEARKWPDWMKREYEIRREQERSNSPKLAAASLPAEGDKEPKTQGQVKFGATAANPGLE